MSEAERETIELSPEGEARRRQILLRAQAAQRWRVRRRRTLGGGATAVVLLLVTGVAFRAMPSGPGAEPDRLAVQHEEPAPASLVQIVTTSAASYERLAASPQTSSVERISDDELLRLLHAEGHDVGLVRSQGRVIIIGGGKPESFEAETSG